MADTSLADYFTIAPSSTTWGLGQNALVQALPILMQGRGTTNQQFGTALGMSLVSALLGYQARRSAADQSLQAAELGSQMLGLATPQERLNLIKGVDSSNIQQSLLGLNARIGEQDLLNTFARKQAETLANAKMEMELGPLGERLYQRDLQKEIAIQKLRNAPEMARLARESQKAPLDPTVDAYIKAGLASPQEEFALRLGKTSVSELLANKQIKPPTETQQVTPVDVTNILKEPQIETLPDPRTTSPAEMKAAEARIRQQEKQYQRWSQQTNRDDRLQAKADDKLNNSQFYKDGYEPIARTHLELSNLVRQRGSFDRLTQADAQKMVTMIQKMIDKSQVTLGEFKTYGRTLGPLADRWASRLNNYVTGASEIPPGALQEMFNFADSLAKTNQQIYQEEASNISKQYDVPIEKIKRPIGLKKATSTNPREQIINELKSRGYTDEQISARLKG